MSLHILHALTTYASRFVVCRCHEAVHSNAELHVSKHLKKSTRFIKALAMKVEEMLLMSSLVSAHDN
jgi:hypothetical protein